MLTFIIIRNTMAKFYIHTTKFIMKANALIKNNVGYSSLCTNRENSLDILHIFKINMF